MSISNNSSVKSFSEVEKSGDSGHGSGSRAKQFGSKELKESSGSLTASRKHAQSLPLSTNLGALIGIPNPNVSQNVMISIIEDPIQCGYLYAFCESEHCVENLSFVMAVIRFRELLMVDMASWTSPWPELDSLFASLEQVLTSSGALNATTGEVNLSLLSEEDKVKYNMVQTWPSRRLEKGPADQAVADIWNTYLSDSGESQICMPHRVLLNTQRRMRQMCVYGPDTFGEALLDPVNTLQRDTLPRFLNSDLCTDMVLRIDSLRALPSAASIRVIPPTDSLLFTKNTDYFKESRRFKLDEILHDKILYSEFLGHLRRSVQSENLLCVRMVEMFEVIVDTDPARAVSQAWNIYRYFVAPGSAYEVSLYSRHKKELMLSLARPHRGMFVELKKSAYSMLSVNFNNYKFTEGYAQLSTLMRDEKNKALSSTRLSLSALLWPKK